MKYQEKRPEEKTRPKNTKGILLVVAIVVFLLGSYIATWFFLPQLGLAGPMANLSYFYYGKSHTKSDSALYIVYYPLYWYEMKTKGYSRYGIHWSDRKDPSPPSSQ
jgi:flagellar basal body-associated protein FliL